MNRFFLLLPFLALAVPAGADPATNALDAAAALADRGLPADALALYREALASSNEPPEASVAEFRRALAGARDCLRRLGRDAESADFLEEVLAAHPLRPSTGRDRHGDRCEPRTEDRGTAPLRIAAADEMRRLPSRGSFVEDRFVRGRAAGYGELGASCAERDRVRALQVLDELLPRADSLAADDAAALWAALADALQRGREGRLSWRLLEKTDLAAAPEPELGWGASHEEGPAPSGPDGAPVLHTVPSAWAAAANDGERWRWAVARLAATDDAAAARRLLAFAARQFGPNTIGARDADAEAFAALGDGETMARLASGVRRFALPDDLNPILLAERCGEPFALGQWLEARRQLDRASEAYRRAAAAADRTEVAERARARLGAILDPWIEPDVAGGFTPERAPAFDLAFRNATNALFELRPFDRRRLAADTEALILSESTNRIGWNPADPIGRLQQGDGTNYLGAPVASWSMALAPDPRHFDRTVRAEAPAPLPAGLYLLRAEADGGNAAHRLLEVADTAVLAPAPGRDPGENGVAFLVADARDGRPIAGATVRCLSWARWEGTNWAHFANDATTDSAGTAALPWKDVLAGKWSAQHLCTVSDAKGRFAVVPAGHFARPGRVHLENGLLGRAHRAGAPTPFAVTDRPAYRPGATVRWKAWVERTDVPPEDDERKAVRDGRSISVRPLGPGARWAGEETVVAIHGPNGAKIAETRAKADEFGSVEGETALPADAALGVYRVSVRVPDAARYGASAGAGSFRVEEYRKPEFEAAVETPSAPLAPGARATARIRAAYLFGAPLEGGRARVTVERTADDAPWLPPCRWDWLYGAGYCFYAADWPWHPLWGTCLVRAPAGDDPWRARIRPWRPPVPPEVVATFEVPLGADGTAEVSWDTAPALARHGAERDQRYRVRAEVTDAADRTVDAEGAVLVTAHPFRVRAWTARPWCHDGDTVELRALVTGDFAARGVRIDGAAALWRIDPATGEDAEPLGPLSPPEEWEWRDGRTPGALWRFPAPPRGQYRLAVAAQDTEGREEVCSVLLTVLSAGGDPARDLRFAPLELVPDREDYAPGDTARLALRADRADGWVHVTTRAGTARAEPRWVRLDGKTAEIALAIDELDRPDVFVEAIAFHDGRFRRLVRRLAVPPGDKGAKVEVEAPAGRLAPGDEAQVTVRVSGPDGAPATNASVAVAVYDRAVERAVGGSRVPAILPWFWGWRGVYLPNYAASLRENGFGRYWSLPGDAAMPRLGDWGWLWLADDPDNPPASARPAEITSVANVKSPIVMPGIRANRSPGQRGRALAAGAPTAAPDDDGGGAPDDDGGGSAEEPPAVRERFADTAFWGSFPNAAGAAGLAPVPGEPGVFRARFAMPEDATGWRVRAWAVLPGACVGEGDARFATERDVLVAPALPRFLVEGDAATIPVVVHNRTDEPLSLAVALAETNGVLARAPGAAGGFSETRRLDVPAHGTARADFPVVAAAEGDAALVASAVAPGGGRARSDGVARTIPVRPRGVRAAESFSRVLDERNPAAEIRFRVPEEGGDPALELRAADSLLPALWEAVPWLLGYPHGCTEQTLNRFVPAVLVRKALRDAGRSLEEFAPDEAAPEAARLAAAGPAPIARRPRPRPAALTDADLDRLVETGLVRLARMRLGDGGWGWFDGDREQSTVHATATVAHGLHVAREAGADIRLGAFETGLFWLQRDQARRLRELAGDAGARTTAEDALTVAVLVERGARSDPAMLERLYGDRGRLPVYAQALLGLALDRLRDPRRDEIVRILRQRIVRDPENQTARLELGNGDCWWLWYGSDTEAQAAALRLLARADPRSPDAAGLARSLMLDRVHATHWKSTRDTALVLEALLEFERAVGAPGAVGGGPVALRVLLDGRPLDTPDGGSFALRVGADRLAPGEHVLRVERAAPGGGPVYLSASFERLSLAAPGRPIEAAGLGVKVRRTVSRLTPRTARAAGRDASGAPVEIGRAAIDRAELGDGDRIAPGDLLEVRLDVEAKNDCEYILVEDRKAAGLEPVESLSGYRPQGRLAPYAEWRDDRVRFYLPWLPRGTHSLSYRLRAETPGVFLALPATAEAMYDPDGLRGNSDSRRLSVGAPAGSGGKSPAAP